jgi:hypothetical protein
VGYVARMDETINKYGWNNTYTMLMGILKGRDTLNTWT